MGEIKWGKRAGAAMATCAVLLLSACGGGSSGDDIVRNGDDILRAFTNAPEAPVLPPPVADDLTTIVTPSQRSLAQEAEQDPDIRALVCFSYDSLYDPTTGEFSIPSAESLSASALQAAAPAGSRLYWEDKVASFQSLLQAADSQDFVDAVNAVGCF